MDETFIGVRGVDEKIFRKFRALAVSERMKLGKAISLAMRDFLQREEEREFNYNPNNLLKLSGIIKLDKKVNLSEQIDDLLYGSKNDIS